MKKTIEISESLYEKLGEIAQTFETPEGVIQRLMEFYAENHEGSDVKTIYQGPNQKTVISEVRTYGKLEINFYPSDPQLFKQQLLQEKHAWVMLHRHDGSKDLHEWNAVRFTEQSDVLGNLRSGYLRGWRDKGIVKAEIAINREDIL